MSDLTDLRQEKDTFFKTHPQSPLPRDQRRSFTGLSYFPENEALRLELPVEVFDNQETVQMQTTTGDVRDFVRYGRIKFSVDGQEAELTLYSNEHGFFLPFADALAGTETYGAGRYLEPEPLADGRLLVDFNLAYNPYCAYNEMYSCPITPKENRVKVAVRAGEKTFQDAGHE